MKKWMIALLILILPIAIPAAEEAVDKQVDKQTVEQLLDLINAKSMVNAMYSEMDKLFEGMATQLGIKESEQPIFDKFLKKIIHLMKEEMTWEKMKDPLIEIYMKHYTNKEIEEILAFYKTDTGQHLIQKMPIVMQESMQVSQQMLSAFLPKIQALSEELEAELKQTRNHPVESEPTKDDSQ